METNDALEAFAALGQPTRLQAMRLLVELLPEGLPSGEIATRLMVPQNSMSTHLLILARAGLLQSERRSRQIFYTADLDGVRRLTTFLINECCGGRPEICRPLIDALIPCCTPKERSDA
ncbi:ArsR/SmtB family transcription factor [Devosia sp.]|uniref:ArsR/SmtB family transcription factor n=1 Tax=Devosia sp. TaxID=1871048 RepID=UPI003F70A861